MADPGNTWLNLLGTFSNFFQLGKGNGGVKGVGPASLEARNASDSGFSTLSVAAPTADDHAVTKAYADSLESPRIVARQADTSVAIPNNTAQAGYVVVTEPGNGAVIGDLLYDDGSSSGQMTIISAVNGRTISVTVSLTGNTVEFEPDSLYQWDADGSSGSVQWYKIGDVGSIANARKTTRFAITNAATEQSTNQIPAGSIVHSCTVIITVPFSASAEIEIGDGTTDDLFQGESQVIPQVAGRYVVSQSTSVGSAVNIVKNVSNTPAAGAGFVEVEHSKPNG